MPITFKGFSKADLEKLGPPEGPNEAKAKLEADRAEGRRRDAEEKRERLKREREQFKALEASLDWRPVGANVLAKALDVHHNTLQRWLDEDPNAPPFVELGGKRYYRAEDLTAWWNAKAAGAYDAPVIRSNYIPLTPEYLRLVDARPRRKHVRR